ncbi:MULTISPECIES: ParM/StbA family protein [Planktothricoides]|uniref:ParM/StbA family protein n=2 Tax=Planktothricoides raciborskii TaxID=132608 RepID=A0AAU8JAI6_9CYAN|nr:MULTISPECIES: ParM/StbA family protein [Planktothricoides]MBD2544589.1 ParM/StbA family protein [Planktothricoides raciborskii FACHB-1370]MBD2583534.1 ParM/StbA family protein [Planktothricoides raciborskii FACHB-1261]
MTSQQPINNPVTPTPTVSVARPSASSIRTTILSVDLGRTATKSCVSRDAKDVVFIPANVAKLSLEKIRGGEFESRPSDPLLDLWIEYQGQGYAFGQLAADFGAKLRVGASKVEDALVKTLACASYFEVKDDVAVVLGLPFMSQEEFEREKEQIISQLTGTHLMKYRGEEVSINIRKVWVMPEGYGSLIWLEAQQKLDKKLATTDFSRLPVAIVDIGHQTTDCLMIDNFRLARGVSQSEPFGMNEFYKQVAKEIEGADPESLALIDAVNRPKGERFFRPRGATKPANLDDFLPNLKEHFSRDMRDRVLAWLPERVTDVVMTGGGGEFFWSDLEILFKEAKLKAHLTQPSRQANALGQYLYGEAQLATSYTRSSRA